MRAVDQSRIASGTKERGSHGSLDRLTRVAARSLGVPVALILLDEDQGIPGVNAVAAARDLRECLSAPLHGRSGQPIGALRALDSRPRQFSAEDVALWKDFAGLVEDVLHAREAVVEGEWLVRTAAASEQKHTQMQRRLQRIADSIPALLGYWNTELCCEFANDA
jgi:hypothetical protein